jgi:hypothetical protein
MGKDAQGKREKEYEKERAGGSLDSKWRSLLSCFIITCN